MSFSGEPAGSLSASGGNQTGTRTAADGSPSSMSCREWTAAVHDACAKRGRMPTFDQCREYEHDI